MRQLPIVYLVVSAVCGSPVLAVGENAYVQTNLVANRAGYGAPIIDANMLNAWGIALRPPGAGGHIWVNGARTGTSLEYLGDVNGLPLQQDGLKVVPVDPAAFTDTGHATVTGIVYNAASDLAGQVPEFVVSGQAVNDGTTPATPLGVTTGAAKFMFVTKDGTINAWRANTATAMVSAPIVVDYSKTAAGHPFAANSVYTGVAMTVNAVSSTDPAAGNLLFAADFRNNVINVFNNQWQDVTGTYTFARPITVDASLHPYNVMDLGGHLFVTYAHWDPNSDEGFEDLPGEGHVVEYSETGALVKDFSGGNLNSPWGVAVAPAGFGKFGGDVLVANFGDGTVAAFDPGSGNFVDDLRGSNGEVLTVDGVWGLTFGNGVSLGDANALYFTAGPNLEQDGVLGRINAVGAVPEPGTVGVMGVAGLLLLRRKRGLRIAEGCYDARDRR